MTHGVDARVQTVQAPERKTVLYRVFPQSKVQQLTPGDHPVLPVRQRSYAALSPSLSQPVYIAG